MSNDIYSYIKENFGIEITNYQFKRDYIKEPLKKGTGGYVKGELPIKEDLKYLYLILNFRVNDLIKLFNRSKRTIDLWVKIFKLNKSKELIQENKNKTNLEKYGHICTLCNENIKNKTKQTLEEKYGVINPSQINSVKEKIKQTNLKKYGVEFYTQTDEFIKHNYDIQDIMVKKRQNTMRKNKTFWKSKEENEIYELLIQKYSNVIRQYVSDFYPFPCDFYIPEKDLYIEYQGFWVHGPKTFRYNNKTYYCHKPYNPLDLVHQEIIKFWKNKNTNQYNGAINVWTVRDPLKRKTAKDNGLNWIEFFTMKEFMNWYNQYIN